MPHEITIEGDLLKIRLHGDLSRAGIARLANAIARLEADMPVSCHRLTDMRGSNGVNLDFPAMLAMGRLRSVAPLRNPVKSALIAPDPILYGFARMFQMLNSNPSITVAIFPTEESARAWLAEPGLALPAKAWVPDGPARP